jgi:outer membrane lipoprotein carrier protein
LRRPHILGILLGLFSASATPGDPPAVPASPTIDLVRKFYENTTDYKASFRQVVTTKSPKRTFTRTGTVFFKKPGMMRWDYKVPDEVYYVSDGEVLWSYDVEEAVVYRLRVKDSDLFHALKFLTGGQDLLKDFDATPGDATPAGLIPVKLVPKASRKDFQSVTLFVDPKTGEARETEVIDPLGNVSHLWFTGPAYQSLPRSGFDFKPPEGVRVQDVGPK